MSIYFDKCSSDQCCLRGVIAEFFAKCSMIAFTNEFFTIGMSNSNIVTIRYQNDANIKTSPLWITKENPVCGS